MAPDARLSLTLNRMLRTVSRTGDTLSTSFRSLEPVTPPSRSPSVPAAARPGGAITRTNNGHDSAVVHAGSFRYQSGDWTLGFSLVLPLIRPAPPVAAP